MRSYTAFQFTQRAIENCSTCHAWQACRRLPTPGLYSITRTIAVDIDLVRFRNINSVVVFTACWHINYGLSVKS
jgi:hypothetical protein